MKIKTAVAFIAVLTLCLWVFSAFTFKVNAQQSSGDWPMFRADQSHSGVGTSSPVLSPKLLWTFATNGSVWTPSVANGIVYVGSQDGNVYALKANDGESIWNYCSSNPVASSPAVTGGVIYVGSDSPSIPLQAHGIPPPEIGYICALNAENGDKIWNFTTEGWVTSPNVEDGVVYFGAQDNRDNDGKVYALNAGNGSELWTSTTEITGSAITSTPAVVNGVVYYGSFDGGVYALNATTGDQIWRCFTGGGRSSPAVIDSVVYIGSTLRNIYALDAANGDILWNYSTGTGAVWSSPSVANGALYIASDDSYFYALNITNGDLLWNYSIGESESSPAVAGNVVYITSYNDVYALNATNGAELWSFTGSGTFSDPVVADGEVFAGCGNDVYALGSNPLSSSTATPPITATPRLQEFPLIGMILTVLITMAAFALLIEKNKTQSLRASHKARANL